MAIWLLLLVLLAWSADADYSPSPVQIPFSDASYGPDGPWHAVTVSFGDPPQPIDLFPAATSGFLVFSEAVCPVSSCNEYKGGVYNESQSSSSLNTSSFIDGASWLYPLNAGSEQTYLTDTMSIPFGSIPSVGMVLLTSFYVFYSASVAPNVNLGQFWLGNPAASTSVSQGKHTVTVNSPSGFLWQNNQTPSDSFGLHIGSPSLGIPGSLWLGGYDRSRVLGPVLSNAYAFNTGPDGVFWSVDILDIDVYSFQNRTGLLSQGNSSLAESLDNVAISTSTSFLFLPPSVCDAMVQDLPVKYSSKLGIYLWETGASNCSEIIQSASYFQFKFRQSSLVINLPFQLLNLTLESPLVDTPTQYFPCYPTVNTPYALGKAFLQAAFLGTNWAPNALPGTWFLAQAPGPNTASVPDISAISGSDTSISSSDIRWEDTWEGYWTPIDNWNFATGRFGFATPGNITAVVLGPLLFLTVIGLAIYVWRRKRKARRSAADQETMVKDEYAPGTSAAAREMDVASSATPRELSGIFKTPSLKHEMEAPAAELTGSSPRTISSPYLPPLHFQQQ